MKASSNLPQKSRLHANNSLSPIRTFTRSLYVPYLQLACDYRACVEAVVSDDHSRQRLAVGDESFVGPDYVYRT